MRLVEVRRATIPEVQVLSRIEDTSLEPRDSDTGGIGDGFRFSHTHHTKITGSHFSRRISVSPNTDRLDRILRGAQILTQSGCQPAFGVGNVVACAAHLVDRTHQHCSIRRFSANHLHLLVSFSFLLEFCFPLSNYDLRSDQV